MDSYGPGVDKSFQKPKLPCEMSPSSIPPVNAKLLLGSLQSAEPFAYSFAVNVLAPAKLISSVLGTTEHFGLLHLGTQNLVHMNETARCSCKPAVGEQHANCGRIVGELKGELYTSCASCARELLVCSTFKCAVLYVTSSRRTVFAI